MRDHNRPIPDGYQQVKTEDLKREHFQNLDILRKIEYMYYVQAKITRDEFFNKLRQAVEIL
jgi:hypothetical protein